MHRTPLTVVALVCALVTVHGEPTGTLRLRFPAYSKELSREKTAVARNPVYEWYFQIQRLEAKTPASFFKVGDAVTGTRLKVTKFTHRVEGTAANSVDSSELELTDTETGKKFVLPFDKEIEIPAGNTPAKK